MTRLLGVAALAVLAAGASTAGTSIASVPLGAPVAAVVTRFGAPGLVQTTDQGHEWRWYDAAGLDVDLITDDSLAVRRILVSQPQPVGGKPSSLVQPQEYPYLGMSARHASAGMQASGALHQAEPDPSVRAWRTRDAYVVLELDGDAVRKILVLDRASAASLGYIRGSLALGTFYAPRLVRQYAVDYPKRAIDRSAQGVVVVQADIAKTGAVNDVRVIVSSGNTDIDAAEMTSIRKSTFRPARCNDEPCDGVFLDREEYTLSR